MVILELAKVPLFEDVLNNFSNSIYTKFIKRPISDTFTEIKRDKNHSESITIAEGKQTISINSSTI